MINPAKYYNPKLIPVGGVSSLIFFVLSWIQAGVVSMNVVMGYLVALRGARAASKVMRVETIFFWRKLFKIYR